MVYRFLVPPPTVPVTVPGLDVEAAGGLDGRGGRRVEVASSLWRAQCCSRV